MIPILIILLIISFIKYARHAETISINEWLTSINTRRNRIIALIIILFPFIYALLIIIRGMIERI